MYITHHYSILFYFLFSPPPQPQPSPSPPTTPKFLPGRKNTFFFLFYSQNQMAHNSTTTIILGTLPDLLYQAFSQAVNPSHPLPAHHHLHASPPPISPRHFPGKPGLAKNKPLRLSYAIKYCTYYRHTAVCGMTVFFLFVSASLDYPSISFYLFVYLFSSFSPLHSCSRLIIHLFLGTIQINFFTSAEMLMSKNLFLKNVFKTNGKSKNFLKIIYISMPLLDEILFYG